MHALVSAISLSCHNVRRFKKPYLQFHFNRLQILFQDAHPLTPGWRSCRSDAILAWPWNSSHKFMVDKLPGIQPRAKDSKPSLVLVWFRVSFLKVPSVLENQHVTVTHLYKLIESINQYIELHVDIDCSLNRIVTIVTIVTIDLIYIRERTKLWMFSPWAGSPCETCCRPQNWCQV